MLPDSPGASPGEFAWSAVFIEHDSGNSRRIHDTKRYTMNQPINDDSHLWVSWDDYHGLIERLA
ncbi:hypothetical protein NLQ75_24470, partial [Escherichia coli]|nr:hypothetical protein [Escherichia coli]